MRTKRPPWPPSKAGSAPQVNPFTVIRDADGRYIGDLAPSTTPGPEGGTLDTRYTQTTTGAGSGALPCSRSGVRRARARCAPRTCGELWSR
jgi:hypothetical protein